MVPVAQRLRAALVTSFPDYATAVFAERGYPMNRSFVEAIDRASAYLDTELTAVLELPFDEQRTSPMQVFRSALVVVADALDTAGVAPSETADGMADGDPYGLAPGSSSALGDEVHTAHVAWGVAKAEAFMGSRSAARADRSRIVVSANRTDRESIITALRARDMSCRAERNPAGVAAAIEDGSILAAAVDLSHRSSREIITRLTAAGVPTVVYGDAVDDLVTTGLLAQGVRTVVERDRFLADPPRFLPALT